MDLKSRGVSRTILAIVIVVVIIVGVGVAFFLLKPEEKPPQPPPEQQPSQQPPQQPPQQQPPQQQPPQQPPQQPKITIYVISRHPTDILILARKEFLKSDLAKKYNIGDVKTIVIPAGLWKSYIESGKADVAWGGGPTLFDFLYQEGLLQPLTLDVALEAVKQVPDEVAGMPMKRVDEQGRVYWVAAAIASFGFTVNNDRLKDYGLAKPESWSELASPEIGRPLVELGEEALGIADPTASTSNTRMYEIILQKYGWEEGWKILTLMAANAKVYPGSGDVRDGVIRGEIAVGITIDFYGYTAHLENPACEYVMPSGETIVNGDPIALVEGSKHPEAAQAFIAWVLTEGQKIWLSREINRLPANPKVFETPEGQERKDLYEAYQVALKTKGIPFNDTLALLYEQVMQWYFKATLIDLNDHLKDAWKAILSKYFAGELSDEELEEYMKKLGALIEFEDPETGEKVLFTQDYAIKIRDKFISDPAFRDALLSAWKRAALEKYKQIVEELSG